MQENEDLKPEILQEEVLGDKNHWSSDVFDNNIRMDNRP
jgi:hypothetical protein